MIDGSPINRPIWWLDPTDQDAHVVDDEFLLGDYILVAPVLNEGQESRNIYLPNGYWKDPENPDGDAFHGPLWLNNYPAPLFKLPYFVRSNEL